MSRNLWTRSGRRSPPPASGSRAEYGTQSGLDFVYLGEFILDQAQHLSADGKTTGGAQQLELESAPYLTPVVAVSASWGGEAEYAVATTAGGGLWRDKSG